jgi:hypothetical protein
MKGSKFLLAAIAATLVDAYKRQIAEYQTVMPLALGVADDAPKSYKALKAEAAQGLLRVSSEFSQTAIYGLSGNVTFRVMHDYGHLLYDAEFTLEQECSLARTQWLDLRRWIEPEWREICSVVYFADTVEQSKHEDATGSFPEDQRAFVLGHLNAWLEGRE